MSGTRKGANAQLALELKPRGRGGRREGAGRKRRGKATMPHRARPVHERQHPVHVTLRIVHGVPSLRRKVPYRLIKHAMAETTRRSDFRIAHYSVQRNHLHLIVEADDASALSRGVRALEIRIAHRINRLERRRGRLFADRYHARKLETPREVRAGLAYVLLNARRHARQHGVALPKNWIDPYASSDYFDGWRGRIVEPRDPVDTMLGAPVRRSTLWLLTTGWKRRGLIPVDQVPGRIE